MKRKIVSRIMLTLFLLNMLTLAFNIRPIEAELNTWTVDDDEPADFSSIQEAINRASEGDTIYVYSGTYYENVVVNRTISLVGVNRNTTVIDGNGAWLDVITIEANWVNISGFSISGGDSAIYFSRYCSNTSIINCDIYNNDKGLYSYGVCSHTSVIDCNIFNNRNGIILFGDSHVIKHCNIFSNYGMGIGLHTPTTNCVIENCNVWNNADFGAISVSVSSGHVFKNSNIFNNTYGVSFVGNGISPVANHQVTNCCMSSNTYGIYLSATLHSYINITTCDISNNEWGVLVQSYSYDNSIYHNNFLSNAIQAEDKSKNSWDAGYPFAGNYWSDYFGADLYTGSYQNETGNDGIGDAPYSFDVENEDRYPLMNPYPLSDMQKIDYEFYELLANYKELESTYNNLQSSYYNLNATYYSLLANYTSLQEELSDLQSEYDSLTNELNNSRNTMYVSLATAIVFTATTAYLAIRKSKTKPESKPT